MIRLCEGYYLDSDDRQFILNEWDGMSVKLDKRNGQEYPNIKRQTFYTSFPVLLMAIANIEMRRAVGRSEDLDALRCEFATIKAIIADIGERISPSISVESSVRGVDAL